MIIYEQPERSYILYRIIHREQFQEDTSQERRNILDTSIEER